MPRTSLCVSVLCPPEVTLVLPWVRHAPKETAFILPPVSYVSCLISNARLASYPPCPLLAHFCTFLFTTSPLGLDL